MLLKQPSTFVYCNLSSWICLGCLEKANIISEILVKKIAMNPMVESEKKHQLVKPKSWYLCMSIEITHRLHNITDMYFMAGPPTPP